MCQNNTSYQRGLNQYYVALLNITEIRYIATEEEDENEIQKKNSQIESKYKEQIVGAYRECSDNRRFEIERYWGRSTYFSVCLGAILVAFFGVITWDVAFNNLHYLLKNIILLVLSYVATVLSLVWYYVGKGSKEWQEVYEMRMYYLENSVTGGFHKIFSVPDEVHNNGNRVYPKGYFNLKPYPYSVSKLNLVISLTAFVIWAVVYLCVFVCLYKFVENPSELSKEFYLSLLMIATFLSLLFGHSIFLERDFILVKVLFWLIISLVFGGISWFFLLLIYSITSYNPTLLLVFLSSILWLYQIRDTTYSFIIDLLKSDNGTIVQGVEHQQFSYKIVERYNQPDSFVAKLKFRLKKFFAQTLHIASVLSILYYILTLEI